MDDYDDDDDDDDDENLGPLTLIIQAVCMVLWIWLDRY